MNLTIDFLLCIFVGYLGIHKFYEGNKKLGFIYLFTVGLLGIGWIIDIFTLLIKIIESSNHSNNLKNVSNDYCIYPADDFVDDYIVFDLETTGLDSFSDEIIEIGALKYKNNKLIDTFHEYVKPSNLIPNKISNINGITNEDVKHSQSIKEVLPKFINFIEDYTLIAHNNSFDLNFIMQNLKKQNISCIKNKTIDTLSLARDYIPDLDNYKLETLKKFLGINNISHRALSDCEATNAVYQYCKNQNVK